MNKFVAAIAITLSTLVSTSAFAVTLKEAANATYPIYSEGRKICSATAVSPTQLVTAFHCIDGAKEKDNNISVGTEMLDDKQKVLSSTYNYVRFVRTDKKKDVAFIELKDKSMKMNQYVSICPMDTKALEMGDPLWAIGYPKGLEKTLTEGMFSSLVDMETITNGDFEGVFYKTTIPVTGGNSGGGLYRVKDGDYCLAGTTSAAFRDVSFMSYFSPLESLEFITKNLLIFDKDFVDTPETETTPSKSLSSAGGSIDEM